MKYLSQAIAAALLVAVSASAVQAASLAVGRKAEIDVDEDKIDQDKAALWKQFGGWCAISEWHPAIAKCEESTEGDKTFRTLTLEEDGGTIKEELLEKGATSYRYAIIESPLPVTNYTAQFSLVPDDDDADEVNFTWSATFDPKEGSSADDARDVIEGIFKDGLNKIDDMAGEEGG